MQTVAIVDYGLANIRSVVNAIECFDASVVIAETPADLEKADKIILPGVGSFDAGMRGLRARGHEAALRRLVLEQGRPFFGICLGMQFLFEASDEGTETGLGWLQGRVRLFAPSVPKVPHMGWSELTLTGRPRLFESLVAPVDVYFVHSYFVPNESDAAAQASALCDYGPGFVAALEKDNIFACQFHPEKSQLAGMKMFENFLAV